MAQSTGHSGGAHAVEHELSIWPPIIGLGVLIAYLGVVHGVLAFAAGVVVLLVGLYGWAREDYLHFDAAPDDVAPGQAHAPEYLGMVLFLGTEVVLFGGLFANYFNASGRATDFFAATWNQFLKPPLWPTTTINTIVLLLSGVTMHLAHLAIRKDDRKSFLGWLAVTIVMGAYFLAAQVIEYSKLKADGLWIDSNSFGSAFYVLTGTHGFHVFVGLVMLSILFVRGLKGQYSSKKHLSVEAFSLYWHFVDLVWVFVFLLVYRAYSVLGVS